MKTPDIPITQNVRVTIVNTLRDLGVPPHVKGYEYIKTALRLVLECPGTLEVVTSCLYPTVATFHNTTASRVERNIRHAVEQIFDRNDPDDLARWFGAIDIRRGKLTNTEFLARVAEDIRLKVGVYDRKDNEAETELLTQLRVDLEKAGVRGGGSICE